MSTAIRGQNIPVICSRLANLRQTIPTKGAHELFPIFHYPNPSDVDLTSATSPASVRANTGGGNCP